MLELIIVLTDLDTYFYFIVTILDKVNSTLLDKNFIPFDTIKFF